MMRSNVSSILLTCLMDLVLIYHILSLIVIVDVSGSAVALHFHPHLSYTLFADLVDWSAGNGEVQLEAAGAFATYIGESKDTKEEEGELTFLLW